MLRWLVQEEDPSFFSNCRIHPLFKNLSVLGKKGIEQPFTMAISHDAFSAFLSQCNLSLDEITNISLKSMVREIQKNNLPTEMKNQIRRVLQNEGLLEARFEVELLLHHHKNPTNPLPWDPLCEISTTGLDGLLQGIKACWLSLFRSSVLSTLQSLQINLQDLCLSVAIRQHSPELARGKAYSFSLRSPWDRRYMVISYTKDMNPSAFLVERATLRSSYYGKSSEDIGELTKALDKNKVATSNNLPPNDKIKKIAEFLLSLERSLETPCQIDWSLDQDQRFILRRIKVFDQSPSTQFFAPQLNTSARMVWDQSLFHWNPSALLTPFWFSLLPRNLRILGIRYSQTLGVKSRLSSDYEKVFRGLVGILRGRPYLNLAAVHRFLAIGEHHDLAEEIEMVISLWMKRYDREVRETWDLHWPSTPKYRRSDTTRIQKKFKQIIETLAVNVDAWVDQMHSLRESLVSGQWKEKNISTMLEAFQTWEQKYLPTLVPILMAEIQYWNLRSWYYQGVQQPSSVLTWALQDPGEPVTIEGRWFVRRAMTKMYDQMEKIGQVRPKYIAMLDDIYQKLRKFFELLGGKYRELGLLDRTEDLFYLTFEELLAFEEGRASIVSWKQMIEVRREEYAQYMRDLKVPEIWMTTGLVGLASQYPGVVAIKDRKNPLMEQLNLAGRAPSTDTKSIVGAMEQMDFLEEDVFLRSSIMDNQNELIESPNKASEPSASEQSS